MRKADVTLRLLSSYFKKIEYFLCKDKKCFSLNRAIDKLFADSCLTGKWGNRKTYRKLSIAAFSALFILILMASMQVENANTDQKVGDAEFSVIQISDTQYLSEKYPSSWMQLTNWIVANKADYNIKMVIHTGDIVDCGEDMSQWINANSSMSMLLDANIPYTWNAGNHDQNMTHLFHSGNPDGGWVGSQFLAFNATYMRSKPYWVSDINDGKNTAVQFSYGDSNFLVINLEFHANQTALDWMTALIDEHPSCKIIVATHSYLNGLQGYGFIHSPGSPEWENRLRTILDIYPNVFLTISGHYIHTVYGAGDEESSNYTRVNKREETFFNRQMALGDGGPGGDAVRIFTFNMADPNDAAIQVSSYDLYSGIWKNDMWDLFDFRESTLIPVAPEPISVSEPQIVQPAFIITKQLPATTVSPKPTLAPVTPSNTPMQTMAPMVTQNPKLPITQSDTLLTSIVIITASCVVLGSTAKLSQKKLHSKNRYREK
jgi:hypothetical protein